MSGRRVAQIASSILASGVLATWLVMPAWRAHVYLSVGRPMHAWEAALRAGPSPERDDLLQRTMVAPVVDSNGVSKTLWRGVLSTGPDSTRDPREPPWVRLGPNGRRVAAFLEDLRRWPWMLCGLPGEEDAETTAAFRWVELKLDLPDRHDAERYAYQIAYDSVIGRLGTRDAAIGYATAAGHLAGAAAYAVWSGDPKAASLLVPAALLRRGHLPRIGENNHLSCATCDRPLELADGVTENPDGSLGWRDEQGGAVHVTPASWLPERRP